MNMRIFSVVVATVVLAAAPPLLSAAGQGDAAPASDSPAATPESRNDAIRAELRGLGIQTFADDIDIVDFGIPDLSGVQRELSEHAGRLVFLNFWASWCGPCRAEMPSMEVMQAELEGLPFSIVAVNVQEHPEVVRTFVRDHGYTFPVLLDRTGEVAASYAVRGIPTTYFISPDGMVLGMLIGTREWDEPDVLEAIRRASALSRG